ncbi:MAG: site-specific DNA-methyltransferase [Christensenellales bacterium]
MDKLRMMSMDRVDENIEKIQKLFPNAVTEVLRDGKPTLAIDFDVLKQELSKDLIDDKEERYQFTWPDKKKSILLANSPISATLRPCKQESVDFYNTQNLYIEGDNLDVLKLLQETYLGKVKMIYIDPPYNTGSDFVYNDDFAQSAEDYADVSGQYDDQGNRLVQNTESNGRFHTDWLNMIYPRLKVAKDLLSDDGVIFISIDDSEQGNLKKICDEVFGESNFVGELIHQRAKGGGQAKYIVKGHDYILVYAKFIDNVSLTRKKVVQQHTYEINGELYIKNDDVIRKQFGKYDKSLGDRRCFYEQLLEYKGYEKKKEVDDLIRKGELFLELNSEGMHTICRYEKLQDATSKLYSIIKVLSEEGKKELDDLGIIGFSYPKPLDIIKQIVDAGSKKDDCIVLDFFSGSATTAHAVMQLNAEDGGHRKFIMVQLPEKCDEKSEAVKAGYNNICEIGKERIRRAGKKIKENAEILATELLCKDKAAYNDDVLQKAQQIRECDYGFRVLKLDSSNMKDVYYKPSDYSQGFLESLEDNIKPDRTPLDLLFQVMLELGKPLSAKIEEKDIAGKHVFAVDGNDLVACFDNNVTEDVVKTIAQMQPLYAVFRDSSLSSDSVAANFDQIFATYSPNTTRKVL